MSARQAASRPEAGHLPPADHPGEGGRRIRLDRLLVDRGVAPTRTAAQALLLAGQVRVGEGDAARRDGKPGQLVDRDIAIAVDAAKPYVSRGGHKLAAALDAFGISVSGLVCLDVGASTGGFTDLLLRRGARRVYAVDVGRGQLAEALRAHPAVVSMERTNARSLTATSLAEPVQLATVDVAFISLGLVLGPIASTFGPAGGSIVALVKPQFEAGRSQVKGGVVRNPAVHLEVLERVAAQAASAGLAVADAVASPIAGPAGNREFLLHLLVGPPGERAVQSENQIRGRLARVVAS
jgi:23S rRNA (cytidine1920-2'-O)/16S rRNA (cytidine1409-2'-O)-methyltransferase